jgi:hypothetical protein
MEITQNNICQKIEDYLKEKKLNFNILHQNDQGLNYEIYLGSSEANIQVEYDLTNSDDDSVYLQLYTKLDNYGNSFYHQYWKSDDTDADSLEGEIDSLVESTISLTKAYSKIDSKLDQIRDICVEYNIDFDELITIHVDLE